MLMLQKHGSLPDRLKRVTAGFAAALLASTSISTPAQASTGQPSTPINHVIVIIGEKWTFDSLFATYKPAQKGESVLNLLSKKIVKADGSPGPNYGDALQYKANDFGKYKFAPPKEPYEVLPPAASGGPWTPWMCQILGIPKNTVTSCDTPNNEKAAKQIENGLPDDYYQFLLTGGTGQNGGVPDARINYVGHDASHLPLGRANSLTIARCKKKGGPVTKADFVFKCESWSPGVAIGNSPSGDTYIRNHGSNELVRIPQRDLLFVATEFHKRSMTRVTILPSSRVCRAKEGKMPPRPKAKPRSRRVPPPANSPAHELMTSGSHTERGDHAGFERDLMMEAIVRAFPRVRKRSEAIARAFPTCEKAATHCRPCRSL